MAVGNSLIGAIESAGNQIPGANFNFGRIGGIDISCLASRVPPEDRVPPRLPPGLQSMNRQAPLSIQMNGREVARAVVEVLDGQMRVRQPRLGIN